MINHKEPFTNVKIFARNLSIFNSKPNLLQFMTNRLIYFFCSEFIDLIITSLLFFKFCFYVDLICVCLMKIKDSINKIPQHQHNIKILLNKIYKIKRSYIYVIEMTEIFNSFMFVAIVATQISQLMWILDAFYFLFNVMLYMNKIIFAFAFGKFLAYFK